MIDLNHGTFLWMLYLGYILFRIQCILYSGSSNWAQDGEETYAKWFSHSYLIKPWNNFTIAHSVPGKVVKIEEYMIITMKIA